MVLTSLARKYPDISMATRNGLFCIVAGILYAVSVTSAQDDGSSVPDMVAYTGKVFYVTFTSHPVYGNLDLNVQISAASNSNAGGLPSWLIFNGTARSLSGVPLPKDQGWTLLSITTECAHVLRPMKSNDSGCHKSSSVFHLGVLPFSWAEFLVPPPVSTGVPSDLTADSSHLDPVDNTNFMFGENNCEGERVIASLVLCTSEHAMSTKDRIELVTRLSDFLSIPVASIILESSPSHSLKAVENGFQVVSAGPGFYENCNLKENVEIIWTLPCSTVKHLTDFIRVLQHNVDGGRLEKEMNAAIVGWYMASSDSLVTRQNRKRRGANARTVVPTPVLSLLRPTAVISGDYDEAQLSSLELTSSIVYMSSRAVIVVPEESGQVLSSSVVQATSVVTIVPTPALSSLKPTTIRTDGEVEIASVALTSQIVHLPSRASTPAPDGDIQFISASVITPTSVINLPVASGSVSSVAKPAPSSASIFELSLFLSASGEFPYQTHQPLSTLLEISPENQNTRQYTTTSLTASLISQRSLDTRTVQPSIALAGAPIYTDGITPSLFIARDSEVVVLPAPDISFPSPLLPSYTKLFASSTSLLSVLPFDSVSLVTSRTVEIVAFSMSSVRASIDTELSTYSKYSPRHSILIDINTSSFFWESSSDPKIDQTITGYIETDDKAASLIEESTTFSTEVMHIHGTETSEFAIPATNVTDTSEVTQTDTMMVPGVVGVSTTEQILYPAFSSTKLTITASGTIASTTQLETTWSPATSRLIPSVTSTILTDSTDITDERANNRPYVQNAIDTIIGEQGRLLVFSIPHDVFFDVEDGNTSSLTLSLRLVSGQELPSDFWLYLESDKQILRGLPLPDDKNITNMSVVLVARDSQGLTSTDTIVVQIRKAPGDSFTHVFIMKFALDFQQFMRSRKNLTDLITKVGTYFNMEDTNAQAITVLEVKQGSLELSWTNNTLTGTVCPLDAIKSTLGVMIRRDGTLKSSFYRHMGDENHLIEILFKPSGICYVPPTSAIVTTTMYMLPETSRALGLSVWAHVILPVMIAVLVFILIILIIIFCNRRRRHRQAVLNAEKEAVSNDRNPIIFPDELDVDDPSLKARDPLVLPTDPNLANQSVSLDSSPVKSSRNSEKKRNRDQEKTRSRDQGEQEWLEKESPVEEDCNGDEHRHSKKGSKRQRDPSKTGGVSPTSTMPCDRPSNHYLEEEASSRSSTLTSTKSSVPEKRHPKNPPPYWQSQSDPPPYRLPPPYLTDNTTQV